MDIKDLQQLSKVLDDKGFLNEPINIRAKQDFLYLCNKTGYSAMNKRHFMSLSHADSGGRHMGEFLVIGYNTADKTAVFPKELINPDDDNNYVAIVCYNKDRVVDVLVFAAANFKKIGLFGIYKNLKGEGAYGVVLNDANTVAHKKHSFGFVLKNL